MNTTSSLTSFQPPSGRRLLIGSIVSLLAAVLILIVAVLPAEYGIDPTGLGRTLGLTQLSGDAAEPAPVEIAEPTVDRPETTPQVVSYPAGELRHDQIEIPLAAGQGLEFKVLLKAGQVLLYSWQSGEQPLYYDFHGEPLDGPRDYFLSYDEQTATESGGRLLTSFEGTHGWYWRNDSDQPVTIRLTVSGFYTLPGEA